jgi:prophage antirepressor-like protein
MANNAAQGSTPMVFQYNDAKPIRTVMIDGEPWFVAKDVGEVLEYDRTHDLTRQLDEDEKGAGIVRTLGGDQEMVIINESGMYTSIFRSTKPEAKTFRRWVTQEVLPSIRRTGGYGTAVPAAPERSLPHGNKKLPMDMQRHGAMLQTLSMEEAGAWIKLVAHMWNTGGPLEAGVAARLAGQPILHQLQHLLRQEDGHCSMEWVEEARERQREISMRYAANGRMGGRGRKEGMARKARMDPSKAQQLTLRMLLALRNVPLDGLDNTKN